MTSKQLQQFILWCRRERISFTTISAGGVTLEGVVDGKAADESKPATQEPRQTMYQRYAGELGKQPLAKPSEIVPDEAVVE